MIVADHAGLSTGYSEDHYACVMKNMVEAGWIEYQEAYPWS